MENNETIEENEHRLNQAQRLVATCRVCKRWPIIYYDPGCTYAECDCHKWAVPDEDYIGLSRLINKTIMKTMKVGN